jgi:hypothetical protein
VDSQVAWQSVAFQERRQSASAALLRRRRSHLRLQVVLRANIGDQAKLRLEEIDVLPALSPLVDVIGPTLSQRASLQVRSRRSGRAVTRGDRRVLVSTMAIAPMVRDQHGHGVHRSVNWR